MTDITKLPDKWRENTKRMKFTGAKAAIQEAENCSFDLENMLPVWTKITDDPDTDPLYPDEKWLDDEPQIVAHGTNETGIVCISLFWDRQENSNHEYYTHWRPLCDIDYPLEQALESGS